MKSETKEVIINLLKKESKQQRETFEHYDKEGLNPYRFGCLGRSELADETIKAVEKDSLKDRHRKIIIELLTLEGREELIKEIENND